MSAPTSNFVDWPVEDDHKESIQLLCPTKVYHFDDVIACFVKNHEDGFIKRLLKLPVIFHHTVFNLKKMDEDEFSARVVHIFRELKPKRAKWEKHIQCKLAEKGGQAKAKHDEATNITQKSSKILIHLMIK